MISWGFFAGVFGPTGFAEAAHEVELRGLLVVCDFELAGGVASLGEGLGYDKGDGLTVVADVGVLEDGDAAACGRRGGGDGEFRSVEGGEDGDNTGGALGGGAVDGCDGAVCDGRLDHEGVEEVRFAEGRAELCCELGFAGDFGEGGVTNGELTGTRVRGGGVLHGFDEGFGDGHAVAPEVPAAATVRARTMPCLAISILKALCS